MYLGHFIYFQTYMMTCLMEKETTHNTKWAHTKSHKLLLTTLQSHMRQCSWIWELHQTGQQAIVHLLRYRHGQSSIVMYTSIQLVVIQYILLQYLLLDNIV